VESLAARKQVLVARATLERLQVQLETELVREGFRPRRLASAVAGTSQMRSLVIAAVLALAARTRFARLARWAGIALTVLQVVRSASRKEPPSN
jgi:hypothetical protein